MQKTVILSAIAIIAGTALADAQSTPQSLDSRRPPARAADQDVNRRAMEAERNPDRVIGDYKTPRNEVGGFTTGAGSTGSSPSADNPGMRRNSDGSYGGTPENPHPR